ncbi:MAG: metallopeptidase family protein [Pseudomonadota bacterium]
MTFAPDLAQISALAEAARDLLPEPMRSMARAVAIRVVDWPDGDVLREMEIDTAYGLTGLYEGIPLTQKSVMDVVDRPDTVWLYRRPILDEWAARGDVTLTALVTHVVVHEFAHHFGWSDEDIARIDPWWT